MVGPFRLKSDARAIVQPQAPAFRLFAGIFQPFPPPDAIDPLQAHPPTLGAKQLPNPPIAVAPVLPRQTDDRLGQRHFVVAELWLPTLRRARLTNHRTRGRSEITSCERT